MRLAFWRKSIPTMANLMADIERTSNKNMTKILRYWRHRIPCSDCKCTYDWKVMTFDHLDRGLKTRNIMSIAGSAKTQLLSELQKCELVCLNCHKLREYKRDWQPATEADLRRRIGNGIKI